MIISRVLKNKDVLIRFIKEDNKKSYFQMIKELLYCYTKEKSFPDYYFIELLYKDRTRDYKNYVSHKKLNRIYDQLNAKSDFRNLVDKVAFSKILNSHDISTPKVLAHNKKMVLYLEEGSIALENESHLRKLVHQMISNSKNQGVFIKESGAHGGAHTFKIKKGDTNDSKISQLYKLISDNDFIFQDLINQHEEINKIYSKSINTVRVNALYDKNTNEFEILSALMRFGASGSSVDNATQGGFFVPINLENWTLEGLGRSFFKYGGYLYEEHPDSSYTLNGAKIPFGESIPCILKESAPLFDTQLIGWDIAITPNGPTIVEGNHNLHLGMAQMAQGGFRNHEGYMKLLDL